MKIRARRGDAGADQGADDLVEEDAAHLHEDQHVVGAHGSSAAWAPSS